MGYTPSLDGLRALAVLTVVAFHTRGGIFPGGYIGVDIFFVLSGFLITRLLANEFARSDGISLSRFYLRRALRLLPALVVVCCVVALACAALPLSDRHGDLLGTGAALLYISSPLAASGSDLGAMLPAWSLSVEEYFYLAWPVILLLCLRRRLSTYLLPALLVVAVIYRWLVPNLFHWSEARIAYSLDTRLEQLLTGAILAVVIPRLWRIPVAIGVAALAVLGAFIIAPGHMTEHLYFAGGSTVIAVLAAVAVAFAVQQSHVRRVPVLSGRYAVWVGARSYGIYLWHNPIIAIVAATALPESVQLPVKLALVFLVPALSYRYVELPFLRLKDRFEPGNAGRALLPWRRVEHGWKLPWLRDVPGSVSE